MQKRAFCLFVLGAILLVVVFAAAAERRVLTAVNDVEIDVLDPRLARNTAAWRTVDLIYDGLIRHDPYYKPEPCLATSWEYLDNLTVVFELRDNAKFSDGEPCTAEDVVYTYETLLDEDFGAPFRALYTPIAKVEALDPLTVKFTLSTPYAPLFGYLDSKAGIVPKHIAESEDGDLSNNPVGTGPYMVAKWDRGSKIVLEPNPYWWGEPVENDVTILVIKDSQARAQVLEAGDADVVPTPLSPQDIRRLEANPNFAGGQSPGSYYVHVNMNCADPILSDVRVRRALSMLVDSKTIIEEIYENMYVVATSILLPSWWCYTPAITQPPFDPEKAVALLNEAGWTDTDGDGILDKDGEKLALEIKCHSEDSNRIQSMEYAQYTFQQNGIETTIDISDWASFYPAVQRGDYQIAFHGWSSLVDPDRGLYNQFHSAGGNNYGSYTNPELDKWLDMGRTSISLEDRIVAYHEAAIILAEDVPYFVVLDRAAYTYYKKELKGFVQNPRGFLRSLAWATWED